LPRDKAPHAHGEPAQAYAHRLQQSQLNYFRGDSPGAVTQARHSIAAIIDDPGRDQAFGEAGGGGRVGGSPAVDDDALDNLPALRRA
jgi:hypothetical protein